MHKHKKNRELSTVKIRMVHSSSNIKIAIGKKNFRVSTSYNCFHLSQKTDFISMYKILNLHITLWRKCLIGWWYDMITLLDMSWASQTKTPRGASV